MNDTSAKDFPASDSPLPGSNPARAGRAAHLARGVLLGVLVLMMGIAELWVVGALHFDFPFLGGLFALLHPALVITGFVLLKGAWRRLGAWCAMLLIVVMWWLTLSPRADRNWQPDVAELAWAELDGDNVTLHNVRDFEYLSESNYTPRWISREFKVSDIIAVDLAITYWGSPYIAHPVVSFYIRNDRPISFSIETRKEIGESYSAIAGFFRQFELIYIAGEERDLVGLRTNFREGEDVYLYRTTTTPEQAQVRFVEYITTLNALKARPRWYNALTTNCTTSIRSQHPRDRRLPWDWRILLNGLADQMMLERGAILSDGLSFPELKSRAHINEAARNAGPTLPFHEAIRRGRPGFSER